MWISPIAVRFGINFEDSLSAQEALRRHFIIFALANPVPEIDPAVAKEAGTAVIATGSSQYPNQVNNILAFPGLFRGLLKTNIEKVSFALEAAIAQGLASLGVHFDYGIFSISLAKIMICHFTKKVNSFSNTDLSNTSRLSDIG